MVHQFHYPFHDEWAKPYVLKDRLFQVKEVLGRFQRRDSKVKSLVDDLRDPSSRGSAKHIPKL